MRDSHFVEYHALKDELRKLERAQQLLSEKALNVRVAFSVWDDDSNVHEEVRVPVVKEFDMAIRSYVVQRINDIHRILDEWEKEKQQ